MISVKWSYFLYLLWLCYLIVSGILMFSRGFLLTRRTQNEISSCISYENATCENTSHSESEFNSVKSKCTLHHKLRNLLQNVNNSSEYCLPKRSRVVFVIVDALMYEFTEYEENMTNPLYYHNNMPIFSELLDKSPNNTRMYKFIADPPTTTLQRLKGLTAGSLPTFIEAGENFASTEINEDNIIDQLIARGGKVVLLGDDTWDGLYPKRWLRSMTMHSFNTWDLDTVDYTINDRVYTEIAAKDWDLLIVHYIGVDHCGHKFGPNHPEMRRKLQEMNEAVGSIAKAIDNDTTLYVIGDHGMTATEGNHGGDSDAEVTAALFVYSPNKLTRAPAPLNVTVVRQVDLVPTLSAVMGLPIPHSNLGSLIIDAIPYRDDLPYTDWQFALMNLWANVMQVTRYIQNYAESTDEFTTERMDEIEKTYSILSQRVNDIYTERAFVSFATDAKQFLSDVRSMCQEVWIQFDSFSMSRGLLLVFLTIFFNYLIIDGIPVERIPNIFHSSFLWCAYCAMGLMAMLSIVGYAYNVIENVVLTILFSTGMISVCMLAMLVIQNWEYIAQQWYDYTKKKDIFDRVGRACLAMSAGGLFSNSYVVEEGSSSAFLFVTLLFMVAYSAKQPKYTGPLFLLVAVLITLSRNYRQCREQQGMCYFNQESSDVTPRMLIIGLLSLALLVALTRLWLRSCGNLVSSTSLVWRYAPTVVAVCIGGHWVTGWGPYKTPQRSDNLARVAYGVILFLIGLVIVKPLSLYLVPRDSPSVSVMTDRNVIPQLYNHMKDLFVKRNDGRGRGDRHDGDTTPVVCGLATVYSAAYVIVSLSFALLLVMLLSVNFAPSVGIMYATGALTLAIVAIARYQNATNAVQLMSVDACSTVLWMLLSLYHFYGSGHQPALNLIRWSAAFVGTGGQIHHNALPATLVILNTYGSHILFGLTLPLLVLAPYTVYVMWGRVTRHDLARGEIALYERERHFLTCVFNVCVKYIVFFGFRMFMCMLAATIHCRHMMVWKIFTPKLIFEGLGFGVTMISVLLSYLLLIRIHSALDRFLTNITKTY